MRKTKRLCALFLSIIMISSLFITACGNNDPVEPTQAEKDAAAFVTLVDALPANITATAQIESAIAAAEAAYNALSDEAKTVSGVSAAYATLVSKRTAYETKNAEKILADAKTAAISEINNYVDSDDYTVNFAELTTAKLLGTAAINGASDIAAVNTAVSNAKAAIDLIKSDAQVAELAETIVSISVTSNPTKMVYAEGQAFDPAGMVVQVTFADESTNDDFTGYVCTPGGALTLSDTTITIAVFGNATISTTLEITVNAMAPLPTPSDTVFGISASSYAFEVDRDAALRTSTITDLDYLKVYVYGASDAAESIAQFKITFDYDAVSLTLTPLSGSGAPLTVTKATSTSNTYYYLSVTNYFVTRADTETFLTGLIGGSFDYANNYYFKSQFIAKTESFSLDSDLSAMSANGWIATPMVVSFNSNGGNTVVPQNVPKGGFATLPQEPAKVNFIFDGWYVEADFTGTAFNFETTPITASITLNAKWEDAGTDEKEKLGTVKVNSSTATTNTDATTNFMANGSGSGHFTYNRGTSLVSDWGIKVDHILVTVYSSQTEKEGNELLQFKITGAGTFAGLIVTSLDGSISHYAATKTDSGYSGASVTNAWIIGKYFSLFVNLIREKDGNAAIDVGTKLYFSFRLMAVEGSDYIDGDDSDICVNSDGRTFKVLAVDTSIIADSTISTTDLGGTNTAAANTAIVVFNTNGGSAIANVYHTVGSFGGAGSTIPAVTPPTKQGYDFAGWYLDEGCETAFDPATQPINAAMKLAKYGTVTLYAKWTVKP